MFLELYVKTRLFLDRTEGASGIEYAIVAAMAAVVIVAFMTPIADEVKKIFQSIETGLKGA